MRLLLPVIVFFIVLLIASSKTALSLATLGLTLWFENMVPTLLPFMLLSGILTGLGLQYYLCRPFRGIFGRLFHTTENGAYCIMMGFLCGFPMGAFCVADLFQKGQLSRKESARLIPFCNNIGPVYFYSFAIPLLGLEAPPGRVYPLLTFGMYGIPLLYGLLQAHMPSRADNSQKLLAAEASPPGGQGAEHGRRDTSRDERGANHGGYGASHGGRDTHLAARQYTDRTERHVSLLAVIDESVSNAGRSMLRLCGYMILFNILMLPFYALHANGFYSGIAHSVFEISGGIRILQGYLTLLPSLRKPLQLIMLTALSFGGLCCAGQSYRFMDSVGLSPLRYLGSRLAIALLAALFYAVCFFCGWLF